MNQEVNIDNKKKKLKIYYSLLITVICIIGVSFAWFRLYLSQSEDNTLASRTCFSTTLTEDTSKIELTDAFPITDKDGLKQTPFTFTIKNNCDSYVKTYITIKSTYRTSTSTSYLKDNYIKVNISPNGTTKNPSVVLGSQTLTGLDNNSKGYIIVDTGLNSNEEKSYDLRIWMDSAVTTEQGLDKIWAGKIVVMTEASELPSAPNGWYDDQEETLLAALRNNNEITSPLTIPGKEVNAYTFDESTPTFTNAYSSDDTGYYITYGTGWKSNGTGFDLTGTTVTTDTYANSYSELVGKFLMDVRLDAGSKTVGEMVETTNLDVVYYVLRATDESITYKILSSNKNFNEAIVSSAEDDYGTSYYYRGNVENNYVQFANKCWRIVRIAGDGSVKLVLHNDNTGNVSNPCSYVNNSKTAAFTGTTSAFNENYDDNTYIGFMYGTAGASDYTSAHANVNKSTILTNLETWYTNNLTSYKNKIADTIWCNDKTNVADTTYNPFHGSDITGLGYAQTQTYYGAIQRLSDYDGNTGGVGPNLKCSGELSKITNKIGLLTADEVAYAGYIWNNYNVVSYLQENATGFNWWTMSPDAFIGDWAFVLFVSGNYGSLGADFSSIDYAVRPSISLVSDITISGGTGASENPYIVN